MREIPPLFSRSRGHSGPGEEPRQAAIAASQAATAAHPEEAAAEEAGAGEIPLAHRLTPQSPRRRRRQLAHLEDKPELPAITAGAPQGMDLQFSHHPEEMQEERRSRLIPTEEKPGHIFIPLVTAAKVAVQGTGAVAAPQGPEDRGCPTPRAATTREDLSLVIRPLPPLRAAAPQTTRKTPTLEQQ